MIISRYLTREVVNTLIAVTTVLVLAILSQQIVRYLNYAAVGKIPTDVLLELVSYEIPYLLALLLPLCLYLGIMLAYGRLYANNEMAILQLYGYGDRRILRLTVLIALVISAFVFYLMLWVNPVISAKRQMVMESDAATVHLVQTLMPGRFQVSPDGSHVMFVEQLSRDRQRAQNVFLAQEKKSTTEGQQDSWTLVVASEGYQTKSKDDQGQFFVTTDGYRYEGIPGQNDFKITRFGKYWVRIPTSDVHASHEEDETLSTLQLIKEYNNPKRAAELQWRLSIPITVFLLALLAVPLSSVRPRQSKLIVLLPAVLVWMLYFNSLVIARHWLEQGVIPISLGLWWVHGVMLLIVLAVLYMSSRQSKS